MALLNELKVAILTEHGVDEAMLTTPRALLERAGVAVEVIAPNHDEIRTWQSGQWGTRIKTDKHLSQTSPDDYDGLILPGGVLHTDRLCMDPFVIAFVKYFFASGKPVAALGHGTQLLIHAQVVSGLQLTSSRAIAKDLLNAGALWINEAVVNDNGLITGQDSASIERLVIKLMEELREGVHQRSETII